MRLMGTIEILGACSFLGMNAWKEEEGGGVDVIQRQTKLAYLLRDLLSEGIVFPEVEKVMGIAENIEKEKSVTSEIKEPISKCLTDFHTAMHELQEAGEKRGIEKNGKSDEVIRRLKREINLLTRANEEKSKQREEERKRTEEEKRKAEEERRKTEEGSSLRKTSIGPSG